MVGVSPIYWQRYILVWGMLEDNKSEVRWKTSEKVSMSIANNSPLPTLQQRFRG